MMRPTKMKVERKKNYSLPKLLPKILTGSPQAPERLHFPTRDDPHFIEGVGKRHYTINNSTSLQKIMNPEVANRINSYRSEIRESSRVSSKGKQKILLDFKLEKKNGKKGNERLASEGAEKKHNPFNPSYADELVTRKTNLAHSSEKEQRKNTFPIENYLKGFESEKRAVEARTDKRIATELGGMKPESRIAYEDSLARESRIQQIKFMNPTYLSTGVFL